MTELAAHHVIPSIPGTHPVTDDRLRHLGFTLVRVPQDDVAVLDTGDREALLVKLEGLTRAVEVDERSFELPARGSVFTDPPSAVYAPPGSTLRLHGPLLAGVFLSPTAAEDTPEAYAVLPENVSSVSRGSGNFVREVRDILPADRPAARLLVGETVNPPGNWSSSPPHKHDRDAPPEEAELEEIYLFRVDPSQGFGFQGSYSTEPDAREAFLIRDLEAVTIPSGYHPVVAGPGYQLYYLWGLAGKGRRLHWFPDPAHAWVDGG